VEARSRALISLLCGASLLGFSAIFVKWAVPASPVVIGFYRMLFALPPVLLLGRRQLFVARPGVPWAILGGLCFAGDLSLWHTALRWTSAASATLFVGLAPLWVSLVMVVFLGSRLRRRAWLGLLLALAGATVLALAPGATLAHNVVLPRGRVLGGLVQPGGRRTRPSGAPPGPNSRSSIRTAPPRSRVSTELARVP